MRALLLLVPLGASLLLGCPSRGAAPPPGEPLPKGPIARLGYARMVGIHDSVVVSPDGKWAYSGKWFDLTTGKEIEPPVHVPEEERLTRFFSDGSYLVHGNQDDQIFAPKSDKPRVRLPFNRGYNTFDRGGRFCLQVVGGEEGAEVALIDLRLGDLEKLRRVLATPRDEPHDGCLSDNATRAAWLECERKKDGQTLRLCIYDMAASKLRRVDLPEQVPFAAAALGPDGKTAAVYDGRSVYLFDAATGKRTRAVRDVPGLVRQGCEFSPDSKEVAVSTHRGLLLVPTDPTKPARHFPFERGPFLPDSRRMLTQGRARVIAVHDLKTGEQLDRFSRFPAFDGVRLLDEKTAASWSSTGYLVTWDVRTGRVLTEATLKPKAPFSWLAEMRFSPDGGHVAAWTAMHEGLCVLAETGSGKILREVTGAKDVVIRAFFHPFRSEAALYDPERKDYRGVDLKTGKWTRRLPALGEGDVDISPDARTLLSVSRDGPVSVLESVSGKARWQEPQRDREAGLPNLAALVRKGRSVVVVRDSKVSVYDTLSGRKTASVPLQGSRCAVSGNGRWLVVSGKHYNQSDTTVRVHDLAAEDPTRPRFSGTLPIPEPSVAALALDHDGARLITAHLDGTCFVWDLKRLIPPTPRKTQAELWELLSRVEPAEAQPALAALAEDAPATVKLFAAKLRPVVEVAPARIAAWVADLDSDDYDRRTAAERGLTAARDQAEDELWKVIGKPGSIEAVRRAERLLKRIDPATDPDLLRQARAVEVLERLGTKDAVALLEKLAKGAPAARLTREAKESLGRLRRSDAP